MTKKHNIGRGKLSLASLKIIERNEIVVYFGGEFASVDVYTFAKTLIAFGDTVRAVNKVANPGQEIDVRLEAIRPGSFKALIKYKKHLKGLFRSATHNVFWIIAGILIQQNFFGRRTFD